VCFLRIKPALDRALEKNRKRFDLNPRTRMVLFSDLHRGVGDWADDFMHNSLVTASALEYYHREGFTYVELGDGDELYENRRLSSVVRAHGKIFRLLDAFHREGRLCYIIGNHNLQMGNRRWREKALKRARDHISGLFEGLETFESALLGERIFLFHGHQGDFLNDTMAPVGRRLVRCFWRPLQNVFGWRDPTSPAHRVTKRNKIEQAILEWARERKIVAVAGHTHRPMFLSLSKQQRTAGEKPEPYYFNCGSGVHPRCVTCLEVREMTIALVKWHITADPANGMRLKVERQVLPGCLQDLPPLLSL